MMRQLEWRTHVQGRNWKTKVSWFVSRQDQEIFRCVCKTAKSAIRFFMSVRMQQLGSHLTDFNEILYLSIFLKSVAKSQV
jgi:hypothetical protein